MAYAATCSDVGTRYATNQDSACVQVASTPLGEVAMLVVCDGVGGLARGEEASAMVVERFALWFKEELPAKIRYAALDDETGLDAIESDWRVLLARLNAGIAEKGRRSGRMWGTTFSGVFALRGRFVAGHVGDGRILRLGADGIEQISEDQTLLALRLRAGQIASEREAAPEDARTILQAVGAEDRIEPAFYRGKLGTDELMVVCCDGAWRMATNEGIRDAFAMPDFRDATRLEQACRKLVRSDIERGETDNITVTCLSGDLEGPRGKALRGGGRR